MIKNPVKKFFSSKFSSRYFQKCVGKLILRIVKLDFVKHKKYQHCMGTDPFISINKGMILYKSISQARCLLLD